MDEFYNNIYIRKVDVFLNKNLVSSNTVNPSIININNYPVNMMILLLEKIMINGGIKNIIYFKYPLTYSNIIFFN